MIRVVMSAMGCDRRAHYGNVEQPFCGTHGHYGQWPCPDAARVAAALTAAGYGLVAEKPLRITQELLDAQRAKGWADWHPEDYCHRCYETNVSWYVDTQPWTDVMRGGDADGWGLWQEIICIPCFTALADAHYGTPQAWTISRDRGSYHLSRADGLVADAKREALEEGARDYVIEHPIRWTDPMAAWLRSRAAEMRQG